MSKSEIKTNGAPNAIGPYSQAVKIGDFIFLSGQIPVSPVTGDIADSIDGQVNQVFENIKGILVECSLDFADIVKTTVFLTDLNNFSVVNDAYSKYFSEPYPARSCVEVSKLPKGVLIEVEAIASVKLK